MSTEPVRKGRTRPQAIELAGAEAREGDSAEVSMGDEEIRRRAYEIHLERGAQHGLDVDDWLKAEDEFKSGVVRREQVD